MIEDQVLETFLNGNWQDMVTECDCNQKGMVIDDSNVLTCKTGSIM